MQGQQAQLLQDLRECHSASGTLSSPSKGNRSDFRKAITRTWFFSIVGACIFVGLSLVALHRSVDIPPAVPLAQASTPALFHLLHPSTQLSSVRTFTAHPSAWMPVSVAKPLLLRSWPHCPNIEHVRGDIHVLSAACSRASECTGFTFTAGISSMSQRGLSQGEGFLKQCDPSVKYPFGRGGFDWYLKALSPGQENAGSGTQAFVQSAQPVPLLSKLLTVVAATEPVHIARCPWPIDRLGQRPRLHGAQLLRVPHPRVLAYYNYEKRVAIFTLAKIGSSSLRALEKLPGWEWGDLQGKVFAANVSSEEFEQWRLITFKREPASKFRSAMGEVWMRNGVWQRAGLGFVPEASSSTGVFDRANAYAVGCWFSMASIFQPAAGWLREGLRLSLIAPDCDSHLREQVMRFYQPIRGRYVSPHDVYDVTEMSTVVEGVTGVPLAASRVAAARVAATIARVAVTRKVRSHEKHLTGSVTKSVRKSLSAVTARVRKNAASEPKDMLTATQREQWVANYFSPKELEQRYRKLKQYVQLPGHISSITGIPLLENALKHKLAPYSAQMRGTADDYALGRTERQRPFSEDEEWAICCVFWHDYTCQGYPMPAACAPMESQLAVCRAACVSFGITNATGQAGHLSQGHLPSQKSGRMAFDATPFCWRADLEGADLLRKFSQ